MDLRYKFTVLVLCFVAVMGAGTLGYIFIEGWDPFDALYMTVISMTTTGFKEVHRLSSVGRIFTILLLLGSVVTAGVAVTVLAQVVVQGEIQKSLGRRKVEKQVQQLSRHYIVCGYGRCGSVVARELHKQGLPVVIVEKEPRLIEQLRADGFLFVEGDATDEQTLAVAQVASARGLVTSVSTDADNVFIILTARELNRNLFIIARAIDDKAESKLIRAGANRVVMPYVIGGKRMASAMVRPDVVDLIDFAFLDPKRNILVEQMVVPPASPIAGKSLRESDLRNRFGLIVIGIKREGDLFFNPDAKEVIEAGDLLILMGDVENLKHLAGDAKLIS